MTRVLCVLLLLCTSAHARDWRAPSPWPDTAQRVLLIGDSNIYGPIGGALQGLLVSDGFAVWRRGRPSTGLSRPDRWDWYEHASAMLAEAKPRTVVVQFGGNDVLYLRWRGDRKRRIAFRDEVAWRDEYGRRVHDFLRLLAADGRQVFLLSPTNRGRNLAQVERIRDVQREVAATVPGVTFVDMFPLTSAPDGKWLRVVEHEGKRVVVRRWDTVHFNEAGGPIIAQRVRERLRAAGFGKAP